MKAKCEKYFPLIGTIVCAIIVYIGCRTSISNGCIGKFIYNFCNNMLSQDSISIFITIEGILFAGLLTFLGLFLQLDNQVMSFIKEYKGTYLRLLCFVKISIASTLIALVFSIFLYGIITCYIPWIIKLIWGCTILYSILTSIRMIYVYFVLLTPASNSNDSKNKK